VFNLAGQIAGRFSEPLLQTRFVRATDQPGARARVVPEMRVWFNENLESRNFYVIVHLTGSLRVGLSNGAPNYGLGAGVRFRS
jgi:hypothetical protein